MSLIADSGGIYALYDADDQYHDAARRIIDQERGQIIVPSVILAEVDYLLLEFLGVDAELDFIDGIVSGAYTLEPLVAVDLVRSRELIANYRKLELGLADAGVMATAERLGITRILTVDERDFRAVKPRIGPFILLPVDAE